MSEPLRPGLFIDGRGRICELREVGGTWQHPSTTTEPQCLTYPRDVLKAKAEARRDTLNRAARVERFFAETPEPEGTIDELIDQTMRDQRDRAARGETRQP